MNDYVPSEREQKLAAMIIDGVQEKLTHSCTFTEKERKDLHAFLDAIEKEGADGETHIIILRIGNNVRDFIKQVAQKAVWVLMVGLMVVLYFLLVRPWMGKF